MPVGAPVGPDKSASLSKLGLDYWIPLTAAAVRSSSAKGPSPDTLYLSGAIDSDAFKRWSLQPLIEIVLATSDDGLWIGHSKRPVPLSAAALDQFITTCAG